MVRQEDWLWSTAQRCILKRVLVCTMQLWPMRRYLTCIRRPFLSPYTGPAEDIFDGKLVPGQVKTGKEDQTPRARL
jgi:hypothetical protein